jgi:hypothetical protein
MSDTHLQLEPHPIRGTESAWWYEDEKGICVVMECRDANGRLLADTLQATIPWRSLRGAVRRKDKP